MFTGNNNIENIIINTLQFGPQKTIKLIARVKKTRPKTTKQAVYLILKKLKQEEVITVSKKIVSLNTLWINQLSEFAKTTYQTYISKGSISEYFTNLNEGEKIRYYFKSSEQMDAFWAHVLITLLETTSAGAHDFVYTPHYWFSIARKKTEKEYYKIFPQINKLALILVGGNTPLDKTFKKTPFNKNIQIHTISPSPFEKRNYYINIVGDYVVEVFMDEKISQQIDDFYNKNKTINDKTETELKKIISQQGKSKFVISRNKNKAEKLRKKIKKYFYIPKKIDF